MLILSMILFALAVSVDGFGVGFAYGLKNIIIPRGSLLLINLISSVVIAVSMFFGKIVVIFISLETARLIGAVLLAGMGLFMLFSCLGPEKRRNGPAERGYIVAASAYSAFRYPGSNFKRTYKGRYGQIRHH